MKPINEMTLAECLDFIRFELKYFDHPNLDTVGIEESAERIHDLTRWIPVEERMPTEEDGDEHGYVQWWSEDEVAIPVAHYWDFTGVPKYMFTHWRRIDKPVNRRYHCGKCDKPEGL
jgi:hypothetical protein